jgi:hypothetical protein
LRVVSTTGTPSQPRNEPVEEDADLRRLPLPPPAQNDVALRPRATESDEKTADLVVRDRIRVTREVLVVEADDEDVVR